MIKNEVIKKVLARFKENGYEAYLVGGCVRDFFIHQNEKELINNDRMFFDYDMTTNTRPEQVIELFSEYQVIPTGIRHGTVTLIIEQEKIEITTYRVEGNYLDNRHPDEVMYTDNIEEDLQRRDFTMNAVAFDGEDKIVDIFNGLSDIQNKVIKCVGDANKRFEEDALRILRAVRFASTLGFEIEYETKKAIFKNKHLLKNISVERIFVELKKLLLGKNVKQTLLSYDEVIFEIIPELSIIKNFNQYTEYYVYDIWKHSITVVDNIENKDYLKLASLLHDIGKPLTYTVDSNGYGRFYGHAQKSADIAGKVLSRLKIDKKAKQKIVTLIKYHNSIINNDEKSIKKWLNKLGEDLFFDLIKLRIADKIEENMEFWEAEEQLEAIINTTNKIVSQNECFELRNLDVNGVDLINLGIPSYKIGRILNDVLEKVIENKLENKKNQIIDYIKKIIS